ncbi:MAG: glycosyltransferase [Candidatus Zixiibacteriota bacterium]
MSDSRIKTVILVHVSRRWATFHRRHMLLALAAALPESAALICIDRPITPDVTLWKYPRRFWASRWGLREERDGEHVRVLTWRLAAHDITVHRIPPLKPLNLWLARRQLQRYLRERFPEAERVIQWIYHPVQQWLFDALPRAGKVYECYDEYARTVEGEWVASRWSRELPVLRRADLTFVTTEHLMQSRRALAQRAALLPNGVPDFFFDAPNEVPDAIDHIPHPRVGFVGNIRSPVDFNLLESVFRERLDWHLIFVGPIQRSVHIEGLRGLANVHFLGPRRFEDLPGILRRLDVGLITYRVTEYIRVTQPLKLAEYLAVGLPTVSVDLPELRSMGDLIWLTPSQPTAFRDAIASALAVDRDRYAGRAVAAARELTWSVIIRRHVLPELRQVFQI